MNLPINSLNPNPTSFLLQPDPSLSEKPFSQGAGQQGTGQGLSFGAVGNKEVDFSSPSEKRALQANPTSDTQGGQEAAGGGLQAEIMSLLQKLIDMLNQMMGNTDGNKSKGDKSSSGNGAIGPLSNKQAVAPQAPSSAEPSGAPASGGNGGGEPVGQAGSTGSTGNAGGVDSTASASNAPQGMPRDLWQDCVAAGNKHGVDPYILAAQAKQESDFGTNLSGPSGKDGVMQVQEGTRAGNAQAFSQQAGHEYNHASQADQVEMAAVIMGGLKGGDRDKLAAYNGGPNWQQGGVDDYNRPIQASQYADSVMKIAAELKGSVA